MRSKELVAVGCVLLAAASAGCVQKQQAQLPSAPALVHGMTMPAPSVQADQKSEIDARPFIDEAATRIRLPETVLTGPPVDAENWGEGQLPKESVGLRLLYKGGVEFVAEPVPPGEKGLDVEAKLASAKSQRFTDGRTRPFDVVTVGGIKVAVQKGGVQEGPFYGIDKGVTVIPALQWQDDDVIYTLRSDVLDTEGLLAVMASAKG